MTKNRFSLNQVTTFQMIGLMLIAYLFSFAIRMIWVFQFQDNPSFMWNGELMINTNDGYFFASGAQQALDGLHMENPRVFGIWDYGVIFFTTLLAKITPFSLETIILYMPSIISSLVVVPMILIARLYKQTLWGFFAALLGSITWSYYNRTMVGYYDTDMFSAMAPMFILFFLMKSTIDFNLRSSLYAGIAIILYPFLYDQGQAIVYAIGIIYGAYMVWFHRNEKVTYASLILVFIALMPIGLEKPLSYIVHFILLFLAYFILKTKNIEQKKLMIGAGVAFVLFLLLGNVFGLIWAKVVSYTVKGTKDGALHFYAVNQTVREAGRIPFETFANRTSGSIFGVLVALVGYVVLVIRRPAFILALPLIGIGIFSLWGGLRFTVYAVPVAAMSAVYLFYYIFNLIKNSEQKIFILITASFLLFLEQFSILVQKYIIPNQINFIEALGKAIYSIWDSIQNTIMVGMYNILIPLFMTFLAIGIYILIEEKKYKINQIFFISFLVLLMFIPNITHIIGYRVPTVLNKAEVQDLVDLDKVASSKDYTLSWWDYGYPIWYYSDTSTLIDGGKHNNDNYIISKIMFSTSPMQVANLSRLAVETYVDSNYSVVANKIFEKVNPRRLLNDLKKSDYKLPKKTRDVYLYLPYRMLNIFPTVGVFGNLNLKTGKKQRNIIFYPTAPYQQHGTQVLLQNGIIFDTAKGTVSLGKNSYKVYHFDQVVLDQKGTPTVNSSLMHIDGELCVVYLKSYNRMIVMDRETYNSTYVQMFMLGNYDKNLFELVVSSPYSKIYRVKR